MANVTEFTVMAGRTFNDPHESYANFKPGVSIKVTLGEGEDLEEQVRLFQARAEKLMNGHKLLTLQVAQELHDVAERRAELSRLEREISRAELRRDELKREESEPALLGRIADDSPF